MTTLPRLALVLALGTAPSIAQTPASITHYGSACPGHGPAIQTQGLPQLGSTFTVYSPFGSTTLSLELLVTGFSQANTPIFHPALVSGNGCPLLVSPDIVTPAGATQLAIPNQPALTGLPFHLQIVQLDWVHLTLTDAVQCTVGV